jgi:outer membrane receptor protein involved in Fe transport
MFNFKKLTSFILFASISLTLFAQKPTGGPPAGAGGMAARLGNIGRVYGKIVDATTKKPVEFASVVVVRSMGKKDSILGGGLTLENGDFNVEKLPFGPLKIKVTFVGYVDYGKTFMLVPPDNAEMDLGDLALKTDAKVLDAVQVTAEKAQMQLSLDKKVFNVDKNLTATGGTAEDVLKNVPSVTVDADGSAKLRNNDTKIYVDGRPTMMSLNQIPADQIESVEVISNPSAKYEAGTMGGIVNIVLKKNKKPGYNGFIGLGVGTGNRYNGTLNLNVKEGRWNVSGFYNGMKSANPTLGYVYRTNTAGQRIFTQNTTTTFDNSFQIARLGLDYSINNRNTLTFAGNIVSGTFNINSDQNFENPLDFGDLSVNYGTRAIRPKNQFTNNQLQATWKKNYAKKGQELVTDFTYGFGSSSNVANWTTNSFNAKKQPLSTDITDISGGNKGQQFNFQIDYVNPINDSSKFEFGVRSNANVRDQTSYFDVKKGAEPVKRDLNSSFDAHITDVINAIYVNYSSRIRSGISYQVGVRYEQSQLDGASNIINKASFGYNYYNLDKSLFPSVYLSKKLDKTSEIQLNYSRKIGRPDFMQLMPVVQNNDPKNIRRGNPALQPEFVNLAELNYNKQFGNNNWLVSLYYFLETNTIKPLIRPFAGDSSILESTFGNFKDETRYGLDNTLRLALGKNVDFTTNVNAYKLIINLDPLNAISVWAWDGKANLTYKFPKGFSAQVNGNYRSDRVIPGGTRKAVATMDFAAKKTFFGGAANVTFSINDVFNSAKEITVYQFAAYSQESMRRRDLRFFKLSLQMPFGKMDASIFKKRKQGQGGGQDMDFGG